MPDTVRVAIYTRQSIADDKEFGSLDAQREAVESYVRSQPGWEALETKYDDSGFSGGNVERPALKLLLADIEDGQVDTVAVYKLDRLSRSINDFVRLMDVFGKHNVAFVSTTQAFDTSTSMGRMTVNLLATFATFEREMISERTADKMIAARKRGLWTGGPVPFGYDLVDKKLTMNEEEAERVKKIFRLYLDHGSILSVAEELNRRGWPGKTWTMKNGEERKGKPFNKSTVRNLISNPLYIGKVKLKGETFDGVHEPIIDEKTWKAVQRKLKKNGNGCHPTRRSCKSGAVLGGLVRCACGTGMTIHSARKGNRKYLSYVCQRYQKQGASSCPGSRVKVEELEAFVVDQIRAVGKNPELVRETIDVAKQLLKTRTPELLTELKTLDRDLGKLDTEKENLVNAIAENGATAEPLLAKLGEIEAKIQELTRRRDEAQDELRALEGQTIDEADLCAALESFDPIWDQMIPAEKARVLQLLIEQVTYDAREGEVGISFRPGGVRLLAEEKNRETA